MNIPNIITLGRLLSVPVTVWLILQGEYLFAFAMFVLAGISDGVDGFIAKRFDMRSDLGRFLDPLADKTLLVSIYISLGFKGELPAWLVILVVSRDVLIVGGLLLSFAMSLTVTVQPLRISKINTALQITLAAAVLGQLALHVLPQWPLTALFWIVGASTVLSGASYLRQWAHLQKSGGPP